jgi:hypothetical protein
MDNNEEGKKPKQSSKEKAEQIKRDYGRTKKVVNTAKTGARVGKQVATQGGKAAAQAGRAAAQAGVQTAQATAQAAQATIAAIQAAAAAAEATIASAPVWVPVAAIVAGVIIFILLVSSIFMFFFVGVPPPVAGVEPTPAPNICVGLCKASCLASESDLGINTISCTDPTATHCCLPAGTLPPLKFYCQYGAVNSNGTLSSRGSWNYPAPGGTCDILANGCTPTSTAMILSSFGDILTPSQVSQQTGYAGCFAGSAPDISFVQSQGFTMTGGLVVGSGINLTTINNYITHGYYILGGANIHVAHTDGLTSAYVAHAFVITGVNLATGAITISDPTACVGGFLNGTRTLTNVNAGGADVNGWIFAYAIKKP